MNVSEHEDNYPMPQLDEDPSYHLKAKRAMLAISVVLLALLAWVWYLAQ